LTLYTFDQEQHLQSLGLCGPNIQVRQAHIAEMPRVLRQADILFLPFSFEAKQKHIVQTSFPTKMAEYLASGVPILVHAPAYASISRYCCEHQVGIVVDAPDERDLCNAVQQLVTDEALRVTLSANAMCIAERHHDQHAAVTKVFTQLAATG
jgi:glycosyltransferase involved in cell wall biosynthesis